MSNPDFNLRPQLTPDSRVREPSIKESGNLIKVFRILSAGAALLSLMLCLLPATGHDQMWCLYVADRMLHGVRLYSSQLLESNPPLIMWMLLLPSAAAHFLHVSATAVFKGFVLFLLAAAAAISFRLLRSLLRPANPGALFWPFLFAFLCIFSVLPARDFGQRDHLLALLCLPYVISSSIFATASSSAKLGSWSWSGRAAIGFSAALGIALKPHHLLLALAIELFLLGRARALRRSPLLSLNPLLRPEPWAILITCFAYLAAIRTFTPAYLTVMVPLLRDTYWAIGHLSPRELFTSAIQLHLLALLVLIIFLSRPAHSALATLLLVSGLACTLAYYLQGTGWYYQQLPALSFFSASLFLLLAEVYLARPRTIPEWAPSFAAGLCLLATLLTAGFSGYSLTRPLHFPSGLSNTPDPAFFRNLAPGTPVAILSTVVDDTIPPITSRHLILAQRTNNLWVLPAILLNESPSAPGDPEHRIPAARLAQLDRWQHEWMVEDLERWHPALILVARCQSPDVHCQVLEDRHDDLLAWFSRDPAFRRVWSRYRLVRSSGMYDAYEPVS